MSTLTIFGYPTFIPEGRQWFPMILPLVLSATLFAPHIVKKHPTRKKLFLAIATSWLLYSIAAAFYAPGCIYKRYYPRNVTGRVDSKSLEQSTINAHCIIELFDYIDSTQLLNHHVNSVLTVPIGMQIRIWGWATDPISEKPASGILIYIDDKFIKEAVVPLESPGAITSLKNSEYRFSGFAALIDINNLAQGRHCITLKAISNNSHVLYKTNVRLPFIIRTNSI